MNYEFSGKFNLGHSSSVYVNYLYNTEYAVGSIVYLKHKALIGKFERVCIKKITINNKINGIFIVYTDTFNRCYLEDELINLEYAEYLVNIYESRQAYALSKFLGLTT